MCVKRSRIHRWLWRRWPSASGRPPPAVRGSASSRPQPPWAIRTTTKTWRPTCDRSPSERPRYRRRRCPGCCGHGSCAAEAVTRAVAEGLVPRSPGAGTATGGPIARGQVRRPAFRPLRRYDGCCCR